MTKYALIPIKPKHVKGILNGDVATVLRRNKPYWLFQALDKGEMVKCLILCTKAEPYLCKVNEYYSLFSGCTYEELVDDGARPLNGKIVAQFDLNRTENLTWPPFRFLEGADISLNDYIFDGIRCGLPIENLKIFDTPKKLSDYYKPNADVLTKAPTNIMMVLGDD